MVSKGEVLAAYRLILGREPESESAVYAHMRSRDLHQLRAAFIGSPEFQAAMKCHSAQNPTFIDRAEPIRVEVKTDDSTLRQLLKRVERCWTRLGETDPHWSVITHDAYRKRNFDANAEAFYATGKAELDRLIAWLDRNAVEHSKFETCAEFGCGTGRTTIWLAQRFKRVIACDVSKPHLELAAAASRRQGLCNIEFVHVATMDVLERLTRVDVVFSLIVLQHNPPPIIYAVLQRLFRLLASGGVALLQVPSYAIGYTFDVSRYLASPETTDIEMHLIPQRFVFELAQAAGCDVLEVEPDLYISSMTNWLSNTYLLRRR